MQICDLILLLLIEVALCLGPPKNYDFASNYEIIGSDVFFEITEPTELAYTYKIRPAQDFGSPFNESFSVRNIPLVVTDPTAACENIKNSKDIRGNIALIERGECSFLYKTIKAEKAGAIAVIVTDYDYENDNVYIEMVDDNSLREAHIPAGFLLGKNGFVIRSTLAKLNRKYALINLPVNLTTIAVNKMNQPPWIGW